jgi:AcrR family transcriptional regulator
VSETGQITSRADHTEAPKAESRIDPRILRTRKMLREAMLSLLETEAFDTISVQGIAERATVNRATFYAHYIDREALLEDLVKSRFEELLEARQVRFEGNCPSALKVVILAVYDFLRETSSGCRQHQRHFDPFVQSVVQAEVEKVLFTGLDKGAFQLGQRPSLVAATLSWAIYGAAISALRTPEPARPPADADQFVEDVYAMLLPLLIPGATPASIAAAHHQ